MSPSENTPLINNSPSRKKRGQSPVNINATRTQIEDSGFEKNDVSYDGHNHLAVLLQMHGSVWPAVIPWCFGVCLWTLFIVHIDFRINSTLGHNFMSTLVSFLIVTRVTIAYNRFMTARQYLADLYRSTREVVHYTCAMTQLDTGEKARKWRQDVAHRSIIMLRMATAAIEYRSHGVMAWDYLNDEDKGATELYVTKDENDWRDEKSESSLYGKQSLQFLRHGPRTLEDENMRAPLVWAFNLRHKLLDVRVKKDILVVYALHANEQAKLLAVVGEFISAYHGLRKLINTPFPFPLVQMCRTFLFFWIFSLPMVLLSGQESLAQVLLCVFFITYGFLGLENVSMELDDPYGKDSNDFPTKYVFTMRWAATVYEDIYIAIYKLDGFEAAASLRSRIKARFERGSALENFAAEGIQSSVKSMNLFDSLKSSIGRMPSFEFDSLKSSIGKIPSFEGYFREDDRWENPL